jgi:hypothetical protein
MSEVWGASEDPENLLLCLEHGRHLIRHLIDPRTATRSRSRQQVGMERPDRDEDPGPLNAFTVCSTLVPSQSCITRPLKPLSLLIIARRQHTSSSRPGGSGAVIGHLPWTGKGDAHHMHQSGGHHDAEFSLLVCRERKYDDEEGS